MDFKRIFAAIVGSAVQDVQTDNPTLDSYVHMLGALAEDASRWSAVSDAGVVCALELRGRRGERRRCGGPAIGACSVCQAPVCLSHALVAPARICCFACLATAEAVQRSGAPWKRDPVAAKPEPEPEGFAGPGEDELDEATERRRHLDTLGLPFDALDADVSHAYKQLAFRYHPDRAKTDAQRKDFQRRIRLVNDAYEWLRRHKRSAA